MGSSIQNRDKLKKFAKYKLLWILCLVLRNINGTPAVAPVTQGLGRHETLARGPDLEPGCAMSTKKKAPLGAGLHEGLEWGREQPGEGRLSRESRRLWIDSAAGRRRSGDL